MAEIQADERGLLIAYASCGQRNRLGYARLGQMFRCGHCQAELPPPREPIEVPSPAVFDALSAATPLPVLVDFWAPWCGPCKMVAPELVKVAAEGAGRWLVAKVNTEDLPLLAQRFAVSAIPTLALFKGGREMARQAGAMPAAGILQFLQRAETKAA